MARKKKRQAKKQRLKQEFAPKTNSSPQRVVGGRFTRPTWDNGFGLQVPLTPEKSIPTELLAKLRLCRTVQEALRLLRKYHPDVSMAVWNYLRLANIGHTMEIYSLDGGRRLKRAEKKWNDELAPRLYSISNAGLDGFIDILHLSALIDAAMAVEVEVNEDLTDIVDVHWVDPNTIEWHPEERQDRKGNKRKVLIPYQRQPGSPQPVSLEKANFLWVPTDPDGDTPIGNSPLASAIMATDAQMQVALDMQKVLHNQGWPRYDISIALELAMQAAPPDVKADPEKLRKFLRAKITDLEGYFNDLKPDDSFIHFDDTTIKMVDGATNGSRGIDVRAINEGMDIGLMSGTKQMAIFMNRNQGVTETWGTVQFKIYCSSLRASQRGSKRIIENIAKIALRVWGIQGIPKLTYNEVDDQGERLRLEIDNARAAYWSFCQKMGWVDADEAANAVVGHPATGTPQSQGGDDGNGESSSSTNREKQSDKAAGRNGENYSPKAEGT